MITIKPETRFILLSIANMHVGNLPFRTGLDYVADMLVDYRNQGSTDLGTRLRSYVFEKKRPGRILDHLTVQMKALGYKYKNVEWNVLAELITRCSPSVLLDTE